MRVLVVEDEARLAAALARSLERAGLVVDVAGTAAAAARRARVGTYDAIVLDIMLPDGSGVDVCRRLRADAIWTPVLMLTARTAVDDRVAGLDGGADDYLVKPFAVAELLARLRALGRRVPDERPAVLAVGDLTLDPATREVRRGGVAIALAPREHAVLDALMRRPGRALARHELLDLAWDCAYEARSNVVDAQIRRLREKVDVPFGRRSIVTVPGVGYLLRAEDGT